MGSYLGGSKEKKRKEKKKGTMQKGEGRGLYLGRQRPSSKKRGGKA
jgi:hypothetical protein